MKSYLRVFAALLILTPMSRAADDNPFKAAKVGDWTEYKVVSKAKSGPTAEATQKFTLTAKTEKAATIKVVLKVKDLDSTQDIQIDLTKPFDITQGPIPEQPSKSGGLKMEKVKEGTESVTVAGKEISCTFTKMKVSGTNNKRESFENELTVWVGKGVPLSGIAKLQMKTALFELTMELSDYGSKSE